jgi:hypothetical protein
MPSSHKTALIHVLFKFSVCSNVNEVANQIYTLVPCQILSSKLTHCLTDRPTIYLTTVSRPQAGWCRLQILVGDKYFSLL